MVPEGDSLLAHPRFPLQSRPTGIALAFAAGVGSTRLASLPGGLLVALALVGIVGWCGIRRASAARRCPALAALLLVAIWFAAGGIIERCHHRTFVASTLLAAERSGAIASDRTLVTRGWIRDEPVDRGERVQFLLQIEEVRVEGSRLRLAGRVRVSVRDPGRMLALHYGDRLELPLRLREPRRFRNPGSFDYPRYLEGEGVHLLGSLKNPRLVRRLPGTGGIPGLRLVASFRRTMRDRLALAFPDRRQRESRRFLEAILLGERSGEEGEFEKVLRRTGVYHIISISGLHLVLLLGGITTLARRFPGSRWSEPIGRTGAAAIYVLLSGGDDPILRSALAVGWVGTGRWVGRRVTAGDSQALSMVLILCIRPLHLFHPGFQLSFLVTAGLLSGGRPWWPRLRAIPVVGEPLAVSISAWLASTPLMAARFCQVSPLALGMNLLAGPFLAGALFTGLTLMVIPVSRLGSAADLAVTAFASLGAAALRIPGSFSRVPPPAAAWVLLFATAGLARLALGAGARRGEARRLSAAALAGLAGVSIAPEAPFPPSGLEVVALDVGQGDCILLRLPDGRHLLVDAGGFAGSDFDVGESVVVPTLLKLGVRRLDLVALTHAHQDHGGGLPAVLEVFSPPELWLGRMPPQNPLVSRVLLAAASNTVTVIRPTRGAEVRLGKARIVILHPPSGDRETAGSNDDSLVLRIEGEGTSLLLTGDIEQSAERDLLGSGLLAPADLLKVPHHGSRTSAGEAFVSSVHPKVALLSVGEGNPWGFPAPEVLHRLWAGGSRIFRTDRDGAVRLTWDGRIWRARPFPPD